MGSITKKSYSSAVNGRKLANGRARVFKERFDVNKPALGKVALTVAGGAGAGYINSEFPDGVAGIPVPLVAGSLLVGAGIWMAGDKSAENDRIASSMFSLGQGMLAVAANQFVMQMREGADTQGILQFGSASTPSIATV